MMAEDVNHEVLCKRLSALKSEKEKLLAQKAGIDSRLAELGSFIDPLYRVMNLWNAEMYKESKP